MQLQLASELAKKYGCYLYIQLIQLVNLNDTFEASYIASCTAQDVFHRFVFAQCINSRYFQCNTHGNSNAIDIRKGLLASQLYTCIQLYQTQLYTVFHSFHFIVHYPTRDLPRRRMSPYLQLSEKYINNCAQRK